MNVNFRLAISHGEIAKQKQFGNNEYLLKRSTHSCAYIEGLCQIRLPSYVVLALLYRGESDFLFLDYHFHD